MADAAYICYEPCFVGNTYIDASRQNPKTIICDTTEKPVGSVLYVAPVAVVFSAEQVIPESSAALVSTNVVDFTEANRLDSVSTRPFQTFLFEITVFSGTIDPAITVELKGSASANMSTPTSYLRFTITPSITANLFPLPMRVQFHFDLSTFRRYFAAYYTTTATSDPRDESFTVNARLADRYAPLGFL